VFISLLVEALLFVIPDEKIERASASRERVYELQWHKYKLHKLIKQQLLIINVAKYCILNVLDKSAIANDTFAYRSSCLFVRHWNL